MKNKQIKLLVERYPVLKAIENEVFNAYQILENCYAHGGKLLVAGNGGSAADAEHIVGELMKGFKLPRKPDTDFAEKLVAENQELGSILAENLQGALPAIALDGHPALSTAYMNDCEPLLCFAQQVNGYGKTGDVFLGISTSGNSKNVLYAATTAHAKGMKVIGLTDERYLHQGSADRNVYDSGTTPSCVSLLVSDVGREIFWGERLKWKSRRC